VKQLSQKHAATVTVGALLVAILLWFAFFNPVSTKRIRVEDVSHLRPTQIPGVISTATLPPQIMDDREELISSLKTRKAESGTPPTHVQGGVTSSSGQVGVQTATPTPSPRP
jgi:type II secretory pathway component PulM